MWRTNWAGNYAYRASRLHRPASLDEVRAIAARARRLRVVGSRHSFTGIGDADELMTLGSLPADVEMGEGTVSFAAGMTYAELAGALAREGLALHNLASLPHISVGGSIATATHGSGARNGNLATAVAALELVTSTGDVVRLGRGDPELAGAVVGLGACGAVTRVTLDVEPAYEVRQRVFEGLGWDALLERFDAVMGSAYSVSVFSRLGDATEQVWLKSRGEAPPLELLGARPAAAERHPILGADPAGATAQLGVPGPWHERLPHFRIEFTPSAGEEIQSEYFVARRHAVPAIRALLAIGDAIRDALLVAEIRCIAADELWLSPQYGQDTAGLHFTWRRDQAAVDRALAVVEDALAPFGPRPHWGKAFLASPAARYERLPDFLALRDRLDPRGAFRNEWFERVSTHFHSTGSAGS
jgi:alditol oxidase